MRFVFNLLLACLLVGMALTWLAIDPSDLLRGAWDAVLAAPDALLSIAEWAFPYVLTGAVVVVPLAALSLLLRTARRRRAAAPREDRPVTGR